MKKIISLILMIAMLISVSAVAEEFKIICPKHESEFICPNCGWTGGKMKESCSSCGGDGIRNCNNCNGRGKSNCICGGTGYYSMGGYEITCSGCNGRGKWTCTSCGGTGKAACLRCYGGTTGKLVKDCPMCSKQIVCSVCRDMHSLSLTAQFDEAPAEFKYRSVMREPKDALKQYYSVSGTIQEIETLANNVCRLRLVQTDNEVSYPYDIVYFAKEDAVKLLKGDTVTAYAMFISYDNNDQPSFFSTEILLNE